jgi:hypothetical protein
MTLGEFIDIFPQKYMIYSKETTNATRISQLGEELITVKLGKGHIEIYDEDNQITFMSFPIKQNISEHTRLKIMLLLRENDFA